MLERRAERSARATVPEADGIILRTGGDTLCVQAEGPATDCLLMGKRISNRGASIHIPDLSRAIAGFDRRELTRVFNLAQQKEKPLADTRLFERLDKIMGAVIRATRQVPPEYTMWRTPDRDRPLKVFCYHILVDPIHVLDAIADGKYDGGFKLTYNEKAALFDSMEEVARFGEQCRDRVRRAGVWAPDSPKWRALVSSDITRSTSFGP